MLKLFTYSHLCAKRGVKFLISRHNVLKTARKARTDCISLGSLCLPCEAGSKSYILSNVEYLLETRRTLLGSTILSIIYLFTFILKICKSNNIIIL